jgi:GT2 family glycosyltransferase
MYILNKPLFSACIVLYKNDREMLKKAIDSFLNTSINVKLFLVDNSPTDALKFISTDDRVEYVFNPSNPGFGAGHNIAIRKAIEINSSYHLVLNPDIYYNKGTLEILGEFMECNIDVGVSMPKILYPDGSLQHLAKLLPSPIDFFVRRFIPISGIQKLIDERYELHKYKYDKPLEVPFLSGCFMLFRIDVLKEVNGFDENIFMYTEDIDICRRVIQKGYKTIVFPEISVFHAHEKKTFINLNNLKVYSKSAFYYFNKWGWIFDKNRSNINKKTLLQL